MAPLTDEEMNMSPEDFAQAFAEDTSCVRTYLLAAEERGRVAALRELDAAPAARTPPSKRRIILRLTEDEAQVLATWIAYLDYGPTDFEDQLPEGADMLRAIRQRLP